MIAWVAAAAMAGQISIEGVDLPTLIARSEVIVVATISDPPTSSGERLVAEGCPNWKATRHHVTVTRVLKTTADGPAPEDRLAAWPAYTGEMIDLARRECVDGTRKSPIQQRYGGNVDWIAGAEVVLFLQWVEPHGWELVVYDAWEPGKKLKKVEKFMALPEA